MPLSEKTNDYAIEVERRLTAAGFRVTTDLRGAKVQAKIRDAQMELIPYMAVVGPKEAESQSIALRDRIEGEKGVLTIDEAIRMLGEEVTTRKIRQVAKSEFVEPSSETTETKNEY